MSRYRIDSEDGAFHAWIGWDPGLETYYAQVYRAGSGPDAEPVLWVGTYDIVPSPRSLAQLLEPYEFEIPAELRERLLADERGDEAPDDDD